jgi:hypothetical protein
LFCIARQSSLVAGKNKRVSDGKALACTVGTLDGTTGAIVGLSGLIPAGVSEAWLELSLFFLTIRITIAAIAAAKNKQNPHPIIRRRVFLFS